jgi:integrase
MARSSRPWYRADRTMWYTTKDGKQVPLGVSDPNDEAAAWAALQAILDAARAKDKPPQTVAELAAAFLQDAASRVKPTTLRWYGRYMDCFAARFGTESAAGLNPDRVEADSRRSSWSPSSRNNYLSAVETCLRWGGVKLSRSLRKPAKESAGAASVIPPEAFRRLLGHCSGDWHAVILYLWHTGCRPGEAAATTAECVDWDAKVVRLKDHKTRSSTHADRLVYLNAEALEVLTWQRERHGSGLLFRSHAGGPFSRQAFVMKFQRLSKRIGRRVTAYGMRHSYASRALAAGESDSIVAHLLGHASTEMVHRHYAHLGEHARELGEAAARIGKAG